MKKCVLFRMIECEKLDQHPIYYIRALNVLSFVGPLSNILAMYCVVSCPDRFSVSYRANMFMHQLFLMGYDTAFSFVSIPVIFFPMPMGYSAGVGAIGQELSALFIILTFICINLIFVAFVGIHLSRIQMVLPQPHVLKISTKG